MFKNLKKIKAFTLVELMIILTLLTILLAAFAPIYTARRIAENNGGGGVWTYVLNDANKNALAKGKNQFFIGNDPQNQTEMNSVGNKGTLNISSTTQLRFNQAQNQMQFRFGDSNGGDAVGALHADNNGIYLGGPFDELRNRSNSTILGANSFNNFPMGASPNNNVGIGARTLTESSRTLVVAVGYSAGQKSGNNDVIVGYGAQSPEGNYRAASGNILIGGSKDDPLDFSGDSSSCSPIAGNVIISQKSPKGNLGCQNVAIGNDALSGDGSYNTAVGPGALKAKGVGNYNTAVGRVSFTNATIGDNKTFIGAPMGSSDEDSSLYSDSEERVFIGLKPNKNSGLAVMEVHNATLKTSTNNNLKPISGLGDETVIINGDLIIRGQTFMGIPRIGRWDDDNSTVEMDTRKALAGLERSNFQPPSGTNYLQVGFVGALDGSNTTVSGQMGTCGGACVSRPGAYGRRACVCALDNSYYPSDIGVTSYDWNSAYNSTKQCEGISSYSITPSAPPIKTPDIYFLNEAHKSDGSNGCCPIISDIRLKNVESSFEGGLKEIEKMNVKNFTFLSDENKLPHVGVIAQDLKKIFPTAVKKALSGYYEIRWDEIFYSAINAIKELDNKIENLMAKIENNKKRLTQLKKENTQLETELNNILAEIEKLEK